jgi:hypothetical protein
MAARSLFKYCVFKHTITSDSIFIAAPTLKIGSFIQLLIRQITAKPRLILLVVYFVHVVLWFNAEMDGGRGWD